MCNNLLESCLAFIYCGVVYLSILPSLYFGKFISFGLGTNMIESLGSAKRRSQNSLQTGCQEVLVGSTITSEIVT